METEGITIRDMNEADSMEVGRLFVNTDRQCFESVFGTPEAMGEYIRRTFRMDGYFSSGRVRVAELGGLVVGICVTYSEVPTNSPKLGEIGVEGLSPRFDDAMLIQSIDIDEAIGMGYEAYLDCLSVDGGHRHMGVGRALLQDAKARYDSILLYCRSDSDVAISLYEAEGFRTMGMSFGIPEDFSKLGPAMLAMAYERR